MLQVQLAKGEKSSGRPCLLLSDNGPHSHRVLVRYALFCRSTTEVASVPFVKVHPLFAKDKYERSRLAQVCPIQEKVAVRSHVTALSITTGGRQLQNDAGSSGRRNSIPVTSALETRTWLALFQFFTGPRLPR